MTTEFSNASEAAASHAEIGVSSGSVDRYEPASELSDAIRPRSGAQRHPHAGGRDLQAAAKKPLDIKFSIIATVIFAVLGGGGYYFAKAKTEHAQSARLSAPPAVTVATAHPQWQMLDDTIALTGSVMAWDPLNVGAEVSGLRVVEVDCDEGDRVKKGQQLARLNSALLQAQLTQAEARLQSSQASLKKSIQPNREEEINSLKAAELQANASVAQEEALLKEAQVRLSDAKMNARRFSQLAKMGAMSRYDAETRQVNYETAQGELNSAKAKVTAARFVAEQARQKLLVAQKGGRTEDVDISRAVIQETTGQIEQLKEQIAETVIRAPDDGVVSKREAHIGEITSAGKSLFSIIRMNRLELQAQASDIDLAKFKPGQSVLITVKEDDPVRVVGKVKLVSPQVDAASRLGIVKVDLPQKSGLKPGMFVRGEVSLGRRKALTVPVEAVVARNGESFVFTLENNRAVSCAVKPGVQINGEVEIKSGLKPEQTVIAQGAR
ncbi:MAG TPA: efflux RND transporter periplasmic adaptor subunit, partial [Chroococcales cyanobacterium]